MTQSTSIATMLAFKGTAGAIDFYKRAFGATELFRLSGPDGTIVHAEIKIGDSMIMMAEENPAFNASPLTVGKTTVILAIEVPDSCAVFNQAIAAGAKEIFPIKDQFYGHRAGRVIDPFGYVWIITTEIEKVSPAEMQKRMQSFAPPPSSSPSPSGMYRPGTWVTVVRGHG
jgi:PhnB protein